MRYFKKKYHIVILMGITFFLVITLIQFLPEFFTPQATYSLSSKELLNTVQNDQDQAFNKYIEKVIQIEGTVKKISFKNNTYSLLLDGGFTSSYVLCEMQTGQDIDDIVKGKTVQIKGVYKGYLMDAILLNCVLIENDEDE